MDSFLTDFRTYLTEQGLKFTRQRKAIAEVVFGSDEHLTLNQILDRARGQHASVGYATVYRTMKLLSESGLATEHRFDDGQARYERSDDDHHDHIICSQCGRIIEFEDHEIERRQNRIAKQLGFKVVSHRHEIYADCMQPCRYEDAPISTVKV
ncbi:MAG: Fur family transcriptional regulator [Myxococcota bacterium]